MAEPIKLNEPDPAAPPPNDPPPAAELVKKGGKTQRETELEAELETERTGRRKAEQDAAEAQDERDQIKKLHESPPNPGAPTKRAQKKMKLTFFDADEDDTEGAA